MPIRLNIACAFTHQAARVTGAGAASLCPIPIPSPLDTHDLHATLLHLLGLNHEQLNYRHAGRDFRLTDVYGEVVKAALA